MNLSGHYISISRDVLSERARSKFSCFKWISETNAVLPNKYLFHATRN